MDVFILYTDGRFKMLSELVEHLKTWVLPPRITIVYHTWDNYFELLDVELIYCSSEGQFAKANVAIRSAKSDWIVITHDDDILLETTYELLKIAIESECSLVAANAVSFGANSEDWNFRHNLSFAHFLSTPHSSFLSDVFNFGNPIVFSGVLLNWRKVLAAGGFNEKLVHFGDFELWLRLSKMGEFRYVDLVNLRYRLHKSQNSLMTSAVGRLEMSLICSHYMLNKSNGDSFGIENLKNLFAVARLLLFRDFASLSLLAELKNEMSKK